MFPGIQDLPMLRSKSEMLVLCDGRGGISGCCE